MERATLVVTIPLESDFSHLQHLNAPCMYLHMRKPYRIVSQSINRLLSVFLFCIDDYVLAKCTMKLPSDGKLQLLSSKIVGFHRCLGFISMLLVASNIIIIR